MKRLTFAAAILAVCIAVPAWAQVGPVVWGGGGSSGTTFNGGTLTNALVVDPSASGTPVTITSVADDTADALTVIGGAARAAYFGRATASASHLVGLYTPSGDTGDFLYAMNNVTNVFRLTYEGKLLLPDGTRTLPTIATLSDPDTGWYWNSSGSWGWSSNTTYDKLWAQRIEYYYNSSQNGYDWVRNNGAMRGASGSIYTLGSSATDPSSGIDLGWGRHAAGFFKFTNGTTGSGDYGHVTANGAYRRTGVLSEAITLSLVGATTDSSADLLPANSVIDSVACRVTTTITTATDWSVGDATVAARFSAANATLTAGTTSVGLAHVDQTTTSGPRQTSAAKLRITTTGTPGAGAIRCSVFYTQFVAPTS